MQRMSQCNFKQKEIFQILLKGDFIPPKSPGLIGLKWNFFILLNQNFDVDEM